MADKVIIVIQENVSTLTTERFNLLTSQNEQSTIVVTEENVSIISEAIQGPRGPTGDTGEPGPAGANGQGVPTGGTTGQVLAKASATNYDTQWINLLGGLSYQGAWNASTNSPTLTSSVGTNGHYYIVSVAGTTDLNGITDWQIGDWAIFNGTAWQKIDQSNVVVSVNGQTGVVVLDAADVGAATTAQGALADTAVQPAALASYVPYTGATGDVDLGTHKLTASAVQANGSGGGELRTNNGSVAALWGAGGSANGTLYGGWNYDNATANTVAVFGASKTISSSSVTSTELGYISGLTSSAQSQLDSKVDGSLTATRIPYASDSNTLTDTAALAWDSVLNNLYIAPTLGSELITNGTFTGSATGWVVPSGWAYSSNTVVHSSNGTGALQPSTALTTVVAGQLYEYSYTISAWTVGTVTMSCGGVTQSAVGANGTYTGRFLAASNANLLFTPTSTSRFTIDSVSLKRLSGGTLLTGAAIVNTVTGIQSGLGTNTADAVLLDNPTGAITGAVKQVSPAVRWRSRLLDTATTTSKTVDFRAWTDPTSTNQPFAVWRLQARAENGSYADLLTVSSSIDTVAKGVQIWTAGGQSDGNPDVTRAMGINNSGTKTWIDFNFSGVSKSHIGADSAGEVKVFAGGANYFALYNKTGNGLYSYNTPTIFGHYGNGSFGGKLGSGSNSTPTSHLQTAGSTALKVKRITANQALDDTATHWLMDATTSASCTGTPTYSCSHWTNQSDCELRDSHGGCNWNSGYSCSAFDYEFGMGTCSGTSGCSATTAVCTGGDEATCLASDDTYGGSCAWTNSPVSCAGLDQSTCGATSGCTVDTGYCTNNYTNCSWNGFACEGGGSCSGYSDESSCNSATYWTSCSGGGSCTSQGDESSCTSYSYYSGCSGSYDSYVCTGTYFTGSCTGSYGAACQGTPSCGGIDDSGSCGGEAGCTWSSVLTATLPDGETCPDRTYWIYNDSSGGADVQINAASGQTVNEASSYTMAAYRDWVHLAYFKKTASCDGFNESTCGSTDGCTQNYGSCTWDGASCSGGGSCTSQGDEAACLAYTYYTGCSGTYAVSKNWYKFGS